MRFALAAGIGAVLAAPAGVLAGQPTPAHDRFSAQRDAAAARNPLSPRFTVSVDGNRRTFRVGEPISLVLIYDDVPNRRDPSGQCIHSATPVLDRTIGTHDPERDLHRVGMGVPGGICGCVEGGVVEMPRFVTAVEYDANGVPVITSRPAPPRPAAPKPTLPPVTVAYRLTDHVRFDAPGRYRFYIADRVGAGGPGDGAALVSNIIEIDISPRDIAWENETLRRAIEVLDTSANSEERSTAFRALQSLPSRKALDEMARRELAGLFSARDRAGAIAALTRHVDDPARVVSDQAIVMLAGLHATQASTGVISAGVRYRALMNARQRRLRALASAGVLVERLTEAFQAGLSKAADQAAGKRDLLRVTHALAAFPAEVEAALHRLSLPAREAVLTSRRAVLAEDARFAPMLERLARSGSDAALIALADVAPSRARPIILRDLRSSRPRLPLSISGRLTDDTLPAFDAVFLTQLETAEGRDQVAAAMDRIERYGSAAIAGRVRRAYTASVDAHECSIAIPALAYFFRTDPAFAAGEFDAIRRGTAPASEGCRAEWRVDLASLIAKRRPSPALDEVAGRLLLSDDAEAAVSAGEMLAEFGSPAARALIWRGLESWQRRWSAEQLRALASADPSTWESVLEERLVRALHIGKEWSLQAADYDRLAAGCRRWACRYAVKDLRDEAVSWIGYPLISRADGDRPSNGREIYTVRGVEVPLTHLAAQLRFFPRGTAFSAYHHGRRADELWDVDLLAGHLRLEKAVRRAGTSLEERQP